MRATFLKEPWVRVGLACMEAVIDDPSAGELGFTALAAAPDGTLYAARPLTGEVLALTDMNDDLLPETPRVVADGLTFPNGLTYHEGALYISGGAHIYRLQDGQLDTLVDDVPSGGGFWTGGIAISDDRMYVATGASCDFCASDDPARGAILSYALDGTDRQIVATGLRQPTDLAFQGSDLYVVDSARAGLFATPDLDELDRVEVGDNFGFPYCVGSESAPDMAGMDCADATPPLIALPTASNPLGIAAYENDLIPSLQGKLLVVLGGSNNDLELRGYYIAIADPVAGTVESLMPTRPDDTADSDFTLQEMSYRGSGFFPHRPLDVTVTEQGWVYISIGGGRIIVLR
jgi:glucose/arabinose dehydrogenase